MINLNFLFNFDYSLFKILNTLSIHNHTHNRMTFIGARSLLLGYIGRELSVVVRKRRSSVRLLSLTMQQWHLLCSVYSVGTHSLTVQL